MKTLFIDTHLYDINIILFEDNTIIREKHIIGEKHNSRYLLPTVKEVVGNDTYGEIIVVNGPGSFTGVRLGVTVAKTLAYTLNIPIKTITSLDLMNLSSDSGSHIFAISDGNGYFIGEYDNHNLVRDYYYLSNADFKLEAAKNKIETDVSICYELVLEALKSKNAINPHSVNPIYIKLIGVENAKKN